MERNQISEKYILFLLLAHKPLERLRRLGIIILSRIILTD